MFLWRFYFKSSTKRKTRNKSKFTLKVKNNESLESGAIYWATYTFTQFLVFLQELLFHHRINLLSDIFLYIFFLFLLYLPPAVEKLSCVTCHRLKHVPLAVLILPIFHFFPLYIFCFLTLYFLVFSLFFLPDMIHNLAYVQFIFGSFSKHKLLVHFQNNKKT